MITRLCLSGERSRIFLSRRNLLDVVNVPLIRKKNVIQSTNERFILAYFGIVGIIRLTVAAHSIRTLHRLGFWLPCHPMLLGGVCRIEAREDASCQHLVVWRVRHKIKVARQDMRTGPNRGGKILTMLGRKISMDIHHWRGVKGTRHVIVGQTKGLSVSSLNSFLETDRY